MVYPSHYPDGFEGYKNPADYPYEIVFKSLDKSKNFMKSKRAKMRPWLQDFNMGANYTAKMVKEEIQATIDALENDYSGFMLWNASNIYTEEAIKLPSVGN